MHHLLSAFFAYVELQAIAFRAFLFRQFIGYVNHVTDKVIVLTLFEVGNFFDMLFRNYQKMNRPFRMDVVESNAQVVFVDTI